MNPDGNEKIVECGEKTRFDSASSRAASLKANAPWSIRSAIRRIAASRIDIAAIMAQKLPQVVLAKEVFGETPTSAQYAAAQKFLMGFKHFKAMDIVTNDVDGKLVERVIESRVTLAELVEGSYSDGNSDEETGPLEG